MILFISFLIFICVTLLVSLLYHSLQEKIISANLEKLTIKETIKKKKELSTILKHLFNPLANAQSPVIKKYRKYIEQQIKLSGIQSGMEFVTFLMIQTLMAVIAVFFLLVFFETSNVLFLITGGISGFVLPLIWLKTKITQRHRTILRSLPDAIDLLVLSMQAGLDFNAALNKYLEKGEKGPLRDEFHLMSQEIQMGKTRIDSLNNMSERIKSSAINSLISSLTQGIRSGASLGNILKLQSQDLRTQRFQMAEKLAAEAPLKLLFPLLFFIFPTVFIILFGPIVLSFIK